VNDTAILWQTTGRNYYADSLVIEYGGTHWIVETSMDKDMPYGGRSAQARSSQAVGHYVNDDDKVGVTWRYLLVSETDVATQRPRDHGRL
jgi:type III restriction enzyme